MFTWKGCIAPIVFGLLPSLWDIASDYIFAGQHEESQCFMYCFLCLPILMILLNIAEERLTQLCNSICCGCYQGKCCRAIQDVTKVVFLFAASYGFLVLTVNFSDIVFYMSIPCSASIILMKLMAVVVQGNAMKCKMIAITAYESQFEATFQLFIVCTSLLQAEQNPNYGSALSSIASSLLIITKAGIENLLAPGINDATFREKIPLFLKYAPVFLLTTSFRVIGLLATTSIEIEKEYQFFVISFAPILLPFVTLVCAKCFCRKDISVIEIFGGSLGALGGITVWGKLGREGSRVIQLWMTCFHLFFFTPVLVYALFYPTTEELFSPIAFYVLCICGIIVGWAVLPLFLVQIYTFECNSSCTNDAASTPPPEPDPDILLPTNPSTETPAQLTNKSNETSLPPVLSSSEFILEE